LKLQKTQIGMRHIDSKPLTLIMVGKFPIKFKFYLLAPLLSKIHTCAFESAVGVETVFFPDAENEHRLEKNGTRPKSVVRFRMEIWE